MLAMLRTRAIHHFTHMDTVFQFLSLLMRASGVRVSAVDMPVTPKLKTVCYMVVPHFVIDITVEV
jgi:hypothetical protein